MQHVGTLISGRRIRDARLSAGLTQSQLARRIKTSERNIVRWEQGQNQPRVSAVALIADATGHDIDFFLTGGSDDEDEEAAEVSQDVVSALMVVLAEYQARHKEKSTVEA